MAVGGSASSRPALTCGLLVYAEAKAMLSRNGDLVQRREQREDLQDASIVQHARQRVVELGPSDRLAVPKFFFAFDCEVELDAFEDAEPERKVFLVCQARCQSAR